QTDIGRNHARYFDANDWLYFTRERFDLFYPSYGDTWPTFNGAVGMTYEQGGSGRAGLAIRTTEGDTPTLRDRIDHHHTTCLSTVEVAARQRQALLREFTTYFEKARTSPLGAYRTYVVKGTNAPGRLAAFAAHLDEQGIAYGYAAAARRDSGFAYHSGQEGPADIDPGDLLVSAHQPQSVLVQALFEPEAQLADSLTYDITAWALPYAYNLEAYALADSLGTGAAQPPARPDVQQPSGEETPYAYLLEWQSMEEAVFLSQVLQAGVRVRFAERAFETDGHRYAPGTLILTRRGNEAMGATFDRVVQEAAAGLSQPLRTVASGLVTSGTDFGSSDVRFIEKPRVAVLSGETVSAYALGAVWHFFDQQIRYPVTLIDAADFQVADVQDFDVLILPSGSYGDLLTLECLANLRAWVRQGGRLVAMEGALSFLAGQEGFGLKQKENGTSDDSLAQNTGLYGDRDREAISEDVPGSVHRIQMDVSHPLAFGFGATYPTLKRSDEAYAYLKDGWNVGLLQGSGRPVSGFAGYKAQQKIADTLVFGVEEMGRGSIVYLVDNPLFRGFWHGGKLVFANAVFLVGQ
ncbi:MAG: zinc carboxypeptidase, partial [Rhodothermales bacterium]